jgi:hypothetical protein
VYALGMLRRWPLSMVSERTSLSALGAFNGRKDHGVHDREDGGGRTDAEAQRQDDNGRESRVSGEGAQRVPKVASYVLGPLQTRP